MKRVITLMIVLAFLLSVSTAQAAITQSTTGVSPAATTWSTTSGNAFVGYVDSDGWVKIDDGSDIDLGSGGLGVGWTSNYDGMVTIDGNNATDTTTVSATIVRVGYHGSGTLHVQGNAVLNTYGTWTALGMKDDSQDNLMTITNGGTVNVGSTFFHVGLVDGSSGTLQVGSEGATVNSYLTSGTFDVARTSNGGTIKFLDKAVVQTNGDAKIGYKSYAVSTALVSGADWDVTGILYAGNRGLCDMTIENASEVTCSEGSIALEDNAIVSLLVTGESTLLDCSTSLVVGSEGVADMRICDGAEVETALICIDGDVYQELEGAVADSYVRMGGGGMLTLPSDLSADIGTFLGAVLGSSDHLMVASDSYTWLDAASATCGVDYTLCYDSGNDTTTLTALNECVPEPSTLILLLGVALAGWVIRKK